MLNSAEKLYSVKVLNDKRQQPLLLKNELLNKFVFCQTELTSTGFKIYLDKRMTSSMALRRSPTHTTSAMLELRHLTTALYPEESRSLKYLSVVLDQQDTIQKCKWELDDHEVKLEYVNKVCKTALEHLDDRVLAESNPEVLERLEVFHN
ncbi:hypothetical protein PAAG_12342 [Paracoccidioides lutzii Pb01]|uniref:Uncharacterized protein n=1 Tax=Paracoccidioides lutzii (strain ATCC MYA-826 / Pb01) TaxID=502779 RepID=A0A0A2VJ78_PARBA|nr:hypothetical protein PAAG_12342 [Paracoccidioides lutzii Pb01]KGQ00969.1 hypothetical protein PAAG_12342 [Paracoccidioides lutzii Pb01]